MPLVLPIGQKNPALQMPVHAADPAAAENVPAAQLVCTPPMQA